MLEMTTTLVDDIEITVEIDTYDGSIYRVTDEAGEVVSLTPSRLRTLENKVERFLKELSDEAKWEMSKAY